MKVNKKPTEKEEFKYVDNFIASEDWVKGAVRGALKKASRDFFYVKNLSKISENRYLVELQKEFKI